MTLREVRPSTSLEMFLLFHAALRKQVEELQEALEQASKGIATLAAGPWSGRAAQPDTAAMAGSARGTDARKSASQEGPSPKGLVEVGLVDVRAPKLTHAESASS